MLKAKQFKVKVGNRNMTGITDALLSS